MVSPRLERAGAVVDGQVGLGYLQLQQCLSAGELQGGGLGTQALAAFQQIGDVLAAEGLESEGVLHRSGDRLGAVDLAQGDDLLHVMAGIEAALGERLVIGFGLGREGEEAPEELLLAGIAPLLQQCLGMIRVLDILMALVTARMARDEPVLVVDTEPIRIDS